MLSNDYFNKPVEGPVKELSISKAIHMALGGRVFLSKRLSPPMTICNGRVYAEAFGQNHYVFSSDLEIIKVIRPLVAIAEEYGVIVRIYSESGSDPLWCSHDPEEWRGYNPKQDASRVTIKEAYPWYEQHAKEQQSRWMLDHGMRRRTIKEWANDFWYYRIRCNWYELSRRFRKRH